MKHTDMLPVVNCPAKLRIMYQGKPDWYVEQVLLNKVSFIMADLVEDHVFEYDEKVGVSSLVLCLNQFLDEEDLETAAGYFENAAECQFMISYEKYNIHLN